MVVAVIIGVAVVFTNKLLGRKNAEYTSKKYDTYECGVDYEGSAHQQFSVRYYLIGIIFLIFDVEVVFMYPWTLVYKNYLTSGPTILLEMGLFFVLLLGGYLYLRLRGALKWD
jgi:NADH-quinone oxidoreductase subunit A